MLGFLGATAIGPKQKACLAQGGMWAGPVGKKKCVGGGAAGPVPMAIVGGTAGPVGILPKPGSMAYGPIPAQFIGTEKTGAAGPKQKACQAQGGHWIGPEGFRWCQITGQPIAVPVGGVTVPAGSPVSTAMVPPGSDVISSTAGSGLPSIGGGSTLTPEMLMAPGLQPDSMTAAGATGATGVDSSGSPSLVSSVMRYGFPVLAIIGLTYFLVKGKRSRSGSGKRSSKRSGRSGSFARSKHGRRSIRRSGRHAVHRAHKAARRSARAHAHAPVQLAKPVV